MFLWTAVVAVVILAHTAPFPFLLDVTDTTVWRMPETDPPTVYLTFDDGPNPTATGDVLDALARQNVTATFFVIDRHLTEETAPLVRRAFDDGHAVALHSHTRWLMLKTPSGLAATLEKAAARMEALTGHRPCRAFRPHGGNRSATLIAGAARAGYRVIGWGWMLWDFNWFRARIVATRARRSTVLSPNCVPADSSSERSVPRRERSAPTPSNVPVDRCVSI